jgi:hypothetical protein
MMMSKVDKYMNEEKKTPELDVLERLEIENLIRETKEFLDDDELSEKALQAAGWDDDSVSKFGKTVGKSPKDHGFMDACIARMEGKSGWDRKKAGGFCASIVDKAKGTTSWREGKKGK